jgi:urease accessory protein
MRSVRNLLTAALVSFGMLATAQLAWAHPGHPEDGTTAHPLVVGLLHPLCGVDHLLAMLAVGLLAARLHGHGRWLLPTAFLGSMAVGGLLAGLGVPLVGVEPGIALSVLVFGLLLACWSRMPLGVGLPVVALFAALHGWAHVAEMTGSAAAYATGFALSTAALLATGLALGCLVNRRAAPQPAYRGAGAALAAASLLILAGWL